MTTRNRTKALELAGRRGSVEETGDPLKRFMEEVRDFMKGSNKHFEELKDQMKELNTSMGKVQEDVETNRKDINGLKENFKGIKTSQEFLWDKTTLIELRQMEKQLRIRGLPEIKEEKLRFRISKILEEVVELSAEEINEDLDHVFRINSSYATNKGLPRDILIQFAKKTMRDRVLYQHNTVGIRVEGKLLTILKEIPVNILRRRRDYRMLVDKLRMAKIVFRWEKLEGVSFTYKGKRYKLNSIDKANEFLKKFGKEILRGEEVDEGGRIGNQETEEIQGNIAAEFQTQEGQQEGEEEEG